MKGRTKRRLWKMLGTVILVLCLGTGYLVAAGRPVVDSNVSQPTTFMSSAQSILAAERSLLEVIPEPHTMVLFGTALMGIALLIRRRTSH